ncbi:MAG: hypothetical protein KatS3mg131_2088 [Candidatus Tectimicrobiota bacterium]|nr:MAG: hypothetical protein KatS3mg131_2088 [Candidatus Tectomicrobia bacterium]
MHPESLVSWSVPQRCAASRPRSRNLRRSLSPRVAPGGRHGRKGLLVVGLLLCRFEHKPAEVHLLVLLRQPLVSCLQSGEGSGGTRHDTPKEGQCSPVADPSFPLFELLSRAHDLAAKLVRSAKELGIRGGKRVRFIGEIALRKAALPVPALLDVPPRALDKVARQLDPLFFVQPPDLPLSKLRAEKREQSPKGLLDAAVRGRREQDEMPRGLRCQSPNQLVALLLALATGGSGAVRFVHDHKLGAVKQKLVAVALALEEIDAGDRHGKVLVKGFGGGLSAFEVAHGARTNHHGL